MFQPAVLQCGPAHRANDSSAVSGSVWYTWSAQSEREVAILALAQRTGNGDNRQPFQAKLPELIVAVCLHQLGDFPEVLQSLPLRVGLDTVRKNLEHVLESAFAFHHRITPLVCSLFADQELLVKVRGMMNERSMGPRRAAFAIAAYLRAEQQLGRVAASAVAETFAELLIAVSFNAALCDQFFCGGSDKGKARQRLREAVRALMIGLQPANGAERVAAKGARK